MLHLLITATSLEQALILEDDELVDLLRGRRDSAYTLGELEEVAELCDLLIETGQPFGFHEADLLGLQIVGRQHQLELPHHLARHLAFARGDLLGQPDQPQRLQLHGQDDHHGRCAAGQRRRRRRLFL